MSGWLETSQVLEQFEPCLGKGADASADQFAKASLALISVFDLISGMGMASGDMKGNANTIAKQAKVDPTQSLKQLVDKECDGAKDLKKIAGDGKTVTCALLWLARALNFILKMLDVMMKEKTKKLSECVLAGYEVSLKPHHGMMIKGTFSVAVKAAPARDAFIAKLGDSEETVFQKLGAKMEQLNALNGAVQAMLVAKDSKIFAP